MPNNGSFRKMLNANDFSVLTSLKRDPLQIHIFEQVRCFRPLPYRINCIISLPSITLKVLLLATVLK